MFSIKKSKKCLTKKRTGQTKSLMTNSTQLSQPFRYKKRERQKRIKTFGSKLTGGNIASFSILFSGHAR